MPDHRYRTSVGSTSPHLISQPVCALLCNQHWMHPNPVKRSLEQTSTKGTTDSYVLSTLHQRRCTGAVTIPDSHYHTRVPSYTCPARSASRCAFALSRATRATWNDVFLGLGLLNTWSRSSKVRRLVSTAQM